MSAWFTASDHVQQFHILLTRSRSISPEQLLMFPPKLYVQSCEVVSVIDGVNGEAERSSSKEEIRKDNMDSITKAICYTCLQYDQIYDSCSAAAHMHAVSP